MAFLLSFETENRRNRCELIIDVVNLRDADKSQASVFFFINPCSEFTRRETNVFHVTRKNSRLVEQLTRSRGNGHRKYTFPVVLLKFYNFLSGTPNIPTDLCKYTIYGTALIVFILDGII